MGPFNVNGKDTLAARHPVRYLFDPIDASDNVRALRPKLVGGNRRLFEQLLRRRRAAGCKSPFLHTALRWHQDDISGLSSRILKSTAVDYLEQVTGYPAARTPYLLVEHGPGEIHVVAIKWDLQANAPSDLYVHQRDACRMRIWTKEQNMRHGWRDPDEIPAPGQGDLDLDRVDPLDHEQAKVLHEYIEAGRADGSILSRTDIIEKIQEKYECEKIQPGIAGLKVTFAGGFTIPLRGKCYSYAYDPQLLLAGINAQLAGRQFGRGEQGLQDCVPYSSVGGQESGDHSSQGGTANRSAIDRVATATSSSDCPGTRGFRTDGCAATDLPAGALANIDPLRSPAEPARLLGEIRALDGKLEGLRATNPITCPDGDCFYRDRLDSQEHQIRGGGEVEPLGTDGGRVSGPAKSSAEGQEHPLLAGAESVNLDDGQEAAFARATPAAIRAEHKAMALWQGGYFADFPAAEEFFVIRHRARHLANKRLKPARYTQTEPSVDQPPELEYEPIPMDL